MSRLLMLFVSSYFFRHLCQSYQRNISLVKGTFSYSSIDLHCRPCTCVCLYLSIDLEVDTETMVVQL